MALGWEDLTVARTNGCADVFCPAGFLRDDNLVGHNGPLGRMDSTAFQKEHIANNTNSQAPFCPATRNARYLPNLNRETAMDWFERLSGFRETAYRSAAN